MANSAQRTGVANLPLHYDKAPLWLFIKALGLTQAPLSTDELFGYYSLKFRIATASLVNLSAESITALAPD